MKPAVIENPNARIGPPSEWDPGRNGHCSSLMVRFDKIGEFQFMTSAWEPEPDELARLNAGAKLHLGISGTVHPVIRLGVGQPPAEPSQGPPAVSYTLTEERDPNGTMWVRCVGRFGEHAIGPSGICVRGTDGDELPTGEAAKRLIHIVQTIAREQGWLGPPKEPA